jgi:hypothetical protein
MLGGGVGPGNMPKPVVKVAVKGDLHHGPAGARAVTKEIIFGTKRTLAHWSEGA